MRLFNFVFLIALLAAPAVARAQDAEDDARNILDAIEYAYVRGVFIDRDPAAVRAGFHPTFVMSVHDGDSAIAATLDMWLGRMQLDGVPTTDAVRHVIERVDVTDDTAVVKLQIWINGEHTYTDYLSLYRFTDGWKIVTKVFAAH